MNNGLETLIEQEGGAHQIGLVDAGPDLVLGQHKMLVDKLHGGIVVGGKVGWGDDPRRRQVLEGKRAKGDQVVLSPFGRRLCEGSVVGRIVEQRAPGHVQVVVRQSFELLPLHKPMVPWAVVGKDRLDLLHR